MADERIFIARINAERNRDGSYAIVHAFSPTDSTARICSGISEDHLVGYVEGATAGPARFLEIKNGIPAEYSDALREVQVRSLAQAEFRRIISRAGPSASRYA